MSSIFGNLWEILNTPTGEIKNVINRQIEDGKKEKEEKTKKQRQEPKDIDYDDYDTEDIEEYGKPEKNSSSNKVKQSSAKIGKKFEGTVDSWIEKLNNSQNKKELLGKLLMRGGLVALGGWLAFNIIFKGDAETETSKGVTVLTEQKDDTNKAITDTLKFKIAKTIETNTIKVSGGLGGWKKEEKEIPKGTTVVTYLDQQGNEISMFLVYNDGTFEKLDLECKKDLTLYYYGFGKTKNRSGISYTLRETEENEINEDEINEDEIEENEVKEGETKGKNKNRRIAWPRQPLVVFPEKNSDGTNTVYLEDVGFAYIDPTFIDFSNTLTGTSYHLINVSKDTVVKSTPSDVVTGDLENEESNIIYTIDITDGMQIVKDCDMEGYLETFDGNYISTANIETMLTLTSEGIEMTGLNYKIEEEEISQISEGTIAIGRTNKTITRKKGFFSDQEFVIPAGSIVTMESNGTTTIYTDEGIYDLADISDSEEMNIMYTRTAEFVSADGEIQLYTADGSPAKDENGDLIKAAIGEKVIILPFEPLDYGNGQLVPIKFQRNDTTSNLFVKKHNVYNIETKEIPISKEDEYFIGRPKKSEVKVRTTPFALDSDINLQPQSPFLSDTRRYLVKPSDKKGFFSLLDPNMNGNNWILESEFIKEFKLQRNGDKIKIEVIKEPIQTSSAKFRATQKCSVNVYGTNMASRKQTSTIPTNRKQLNEDRIEIQEL